jgi:hypothetical protein
MSDILQKSADSETLDDVLALALARAATRQMAAKVAGVSEGTVYVRLNDPKFRLGAAAFRRALIDGAIGKLGTIADKAADVLGRLLRDNNPSTRLRSATIILDQLTRLREHVELSERLEGPEREVVSVKAQRNGPAFNRS